MSVHPIVAWQQEFRRQPQVWTVSIRIDGETDDTGNLYDSPEAAELEAKFMREKFGYKSAKVRCAGNVHNMKLSQERWTINAPAEVAGPPIIVGPSLAKEPGQ